MSTQRPLTVQLNNIKSLKIGRKSLNDIIIKDMGVSGRHAELINEGGAWLIADLESTNGTYINGLRISERTLLTDGVAFEIEGFSLSISEDTLYIYGNSDEVIININDEENTSRTVDNNLKRTSEDESRPLPPKKYPYFARSPRLMEKLPAGEIEIEAAPDTMAKPETNWVSIILSSVGTLAVMALIGIVAGGVIMNPLYMVPMAIMGLVTAVINHSSQKKKFKKEQELLQSKYTEYLNSKEQEIKKAYEEQQGILLRKAPDPLACVGIAKHRGASLWARTLKDDDAVSVRVGVSDTPFTVDIKVPKTQFSLHEKQYANEPQALHDKYAAVTDAPFQVSLFDNPGLGIVGNYNEAAALIRSITIHAATHYGYDDVNIVAVFDESKKKDWEYLRFLPHVGAITGGRLLITSSNDAAEILSHIEDELKFRETIEKSKLSNDEIPSPFYIFLIISQELVKDLKIWDKLTSNDKTLGLSTIFYAQSIRTLPRSTPAVIELDGEKSRFYLRESANEITEFKQDEMSVSDSETFARALAPVRLTGVNGHHEFPSRITFMEGYGILRPDELDLRDYWENARPEATTAVPIGIRSNGDKFYFDIHEKKHGPHGLVAGTTGSGKTKMIQSWILSMAVQFSPQDVSFVLIDFKGTGLILPFINLPHIAGTISDLDISIDRNLVALEAELARRKALIDDAKVDDIGKYLERYRNGEVSEPLSYLFVIIDEYAEFKSQYPDFTACIDSLFRTGRSLGIRIIIMAQKPIGLLSGQSEDNVNFRWCLKVANAAASKEVIGRPDAALLVNPGRAYVKVGGDEVFELVQSFYSDAKYMQNTLSRRSDDTEDDLSVNKVSLSGKRTPVTDNKNTGKKKIAHGTEIEAIVNYISDYTDKNNIPHARQIWTEKLPDIIYFDNLYESYGRDKDGLSALVGMLDDPATQKRKPFYLSLTNGGHTVIYGAPGTGKTTFLQTVIYSLLKMYTPDEVNLYLLDFGSWSMGMFSDFPQVGAVAFDNDEEGVNKITELIANILDERKSAFSRLGVGNLAAYNSASDEKLPYIVLAIDNFSPVLQLYQELDTFFMRLTREGGSYGVYLVTSVGSVNGLGFRLQQNIKTNVLLRMADKSDYAALIGRTDGLYPEELVGRGLYKAEHIMEFQTALPGSIKDDNERSRAIRDEGASYGKTWSGHVPKGLNILPDKIKLSDIEHGDKLIIGVSTDDSKPLEIKLSKPHTLLISGTEKSGRTNVLRALIKQLSDKENTGIHIYGNESGLSDVKGESVNIYESGEAFDAFLDKLSAVLTERKNMQEDELNALTHIYVLIDDFEGCYAKISDLSANRLNALARMGEGLKVSLVIAGQMSEFNKYKGMIPVIDYMAGGQVVLLGGTAAGHLIADLSLGQKERNEALKEFEGYLRTDDGTYKFKAVYA